LCPDNFLAYVQRFDFHPSFRHQGEPTTEPTTGMHVLRRAKRIGGSFLGDVIPLNRVRALVDLVPRFGEVADKRLTGETSLECSNDFLLNKYFDKELFFALNRL
jgi:hypothetical protein